MNKIIAFSCLSLIPVLGFTEDISGKNTKVQSSIYVLTIMNPTDNNGPVSIGEFPSLEACMAEGRKKGRYYHSMGVDIGGSCNKKGDNWENMVPIKYM